MPTNTTRVMPAATAVRRAAPVKSPTSTKQTSGREGRIVMAPVSVRPPVHSTTVVSPCAAATCTACTTLARQEAVENGRTIPVVPRMEMPPSTPSRRLVVLRAIRSPSGTLITTRMPRSPTTSVTAWVIIARGTGLIAGPPTGSPSPGLVTTPTPTPPASSTPGAARQETVAVRCAPCVTSGSSPASLTTTARATDPGRAGSAAAGPEPSRSGTISARSTAKVTRRPEGRPTSTHRGGGGPCASSWAAALAAAEAQVPVVQPVRSAFGRTFAVRGRSGSRSSGSSMAQRFTGFRIGPPEAVEVTGMVEVAAGTGGGQGRTDQEQRVLPELVLAYRGDEGVDGARQHQLLRPAHPVGRQDRSLRRVATGEQLLDQLAGTGRGEEHRHGRTVPGEPHHTLPRRHRGLPTAEPGQHDRLGHLRYGQLAPGHRRRGGERGNSRHHLGFQAQSGAGVQLLLQRPPQRGVAGVQPHHVQPLGGGAPVDVHGGLQGQLGGVHDFGARPGVPQHLGVDQAGRPDDDVGGPDRVGTADGDEVRRPRTRPDEGDLHSFPPRPSRCAGISTVDR